jgi:pimeloyl-ACP methyl ester carboxylesterase
MSIRISALLIFLFIGFNGIGQELPCNTPYKPLLFIHGFLGSGDTFYTQAKRFKNEGYCDDRLFVFDWNSINRSANIIDTLDRYIDYLREKTGFDQIDLAGHSAGGGVAYSYLNDADRAAKIAHYIHIGSGKQAKPAGPNGWVSTLNVWSPDDKVVPGGDIEGAVNAKLDGADHYEVATDVRAFKAMFQFLSGEEANLKAIDPLSEVFIRGRALGFGDNMAAAGAEISVFEFDADFEMETSNQLATLIVNESGFFGPLALKSKQAYLFKVQPKSGRTVWYFREGFEQDDNLVYFRTLPAPNTMTGLLFAGLPNDEQKMSAVLFGSNRAFTYGRDRLFVNGLELSIEALTSPQKTTISFVLYDDGDGESSLKPIGMFGNFPFLEGVDVAFPPNQKVKIEFGNREILVPFIPSNRGTLVVVIEN